VFLNIAQFGDLSNRKTSALPRGCDGSGVALTGPFGIAADFI